MGYDRIEAFKWALLSGGTTGIQYKTEKEAKLVFPSLVQELKDYIDSPDYLALMVKEQMNLHYRKILDKQLNFHEVKPPNQ